jgi:hypothetical protein
MRQPLLLVETVANNGPAGTNGVKTPTATPLTTMRRKNPLSAAISTDHDPLTNQTSHHDDTKPTGS